jgi:hypothetical protein
MMTFRQKSGVSQRTNPVKRLKNIFPGPAQKMQRRVQPINGTTVIGGSPRVTLLKLPYRLVMSQTVSQVTNATELLLKMMALYVCRT